MLYRYFTIILLAFSIKSFAQLPDVFCYVKEYIPHIALDIKYAGCDNFIGRPIKGYNQAKAILTTEATKALYKVEKELNQNGFGLLIYDAYRPQKTVEYFKEWALILDDTLAKSKYYPKIRKQDLHQLGYIGNRSSHSRGSTLDLSIINLHTKVPLDMGSHFDYFDKVSNYNNPSISRKQKKNRKLLKDIMTKYGFKSIAAEWWHFTLNDEPFKATYFDFDVE